MKRSKRAYILLFFFIGSVLIILTTFFDNNSFKDFQEYTNWLNDEKNECIKRKTIGPVCIDIKYYPPLYLVMKDLKGFDNNTCRIIDSNLKEPNKTISFIMTIYPNKNISVDKQVTAITTQGASNYSELFDNVVYTNFFMNESISMYIEGVTYKPLICAAENLYELTNSRSFNMIFEYDYQDDEKGRHKDIILEYADRHFDIGKVQFKFNSKDLLKARKKEYSLCRK